MKKIIILLFGMFLFLNGLELKKSEKNGSEKDGKEKALSTKYEVLNKKGQLLQSNSLSEHINWVSHYTYKAGVS